MADISTVFTDKETNNWLKACISLNITKEGLTQFVTKELQKVHAAVGIGCGQCSIENLIPCFTHGVCKKGTGNSCTFHQLNQPRQCQTCDKVKQNIKLLHRFKSPSWKNTKAERWATAPWEIGKCFLPREGYSDVSCVQQSDFNGVLSVLLNCMHFQQCLSSSCLLPPPPDEQCPLEKVRQIGRDVRHTADCKVNDAVLLDYFHQLSILLADSSSLLHDPSAQIAITKLTDLQNNRLSLTELGELLKEAYQTLANVKEAGKGFSEEAERTLTEALHKLDASIQDGENRIEKRVQIWEQHIDVKTQTGEQQIERKINDGLARIQESANGEERRNYEQGVEEMLLGLSMHYKKNLSCVPISPLNNCLHEMLGAIYIPPNVRLMELEKGTFKKTNTQIMKYRNVLFTEAKCNRKTFIEGEAGTGKTTFLAKLVLDWISISTTKTQQLPKQQTIVHNSAKRTQFSTFFDDLTTLAQFKFVFHIALRDSVNQIEISKMIKEQLIDSIYASEEDRMKAYGLLNEIMKHEDCLLLLDGLDEWTGPGGHHNLPTLVEAHSKCVLLITTRPWILAERKVKHFEIDTLLKLEGIHNPLMHSKTILSYMLDEDELDAKLSSFRSYIQDKKLEEVLASPMMLSLIVCSYAEGTTLTCSKCELYTIFLESLLKKANSKISAFQQPPFPCFTKSLYIQPNFECVNCLAKAAFHLLFLEPKEHSLVFGIKEFNKYNLEKEKDISFKSGILTTKESSNGLRSSVTYSFTHKSIQEFLAAFHIACNPKVIDDVITGFLKRHENAYLDITEVLIFLCGLDTLAASKLSGMMNDFDALHYAEYMFYASPFQPCIMSGYREAVANGHNCIDLRLSHFCINDTYINTDFHSVWHMNVGNVKYLHVNVFRRNSTACGEFYSGIDLDLSSCHELISLKLKGYGLWLKDICRSTTSICPVGIFLNSEVTGPRKRLSSIKHIELEDVTCSSTWLSSLFCALLKLDHSVECVLENCDITTCKKGKECSLLLGTRVTRVTIKKGCTNSFEISCIGNVCDGLCRALYDLKNLNALKLNGFEVCFKAKHGNMYLQKTITNNNCRIFPKKLTQCTVAVILTLVGIEIVLVLVILYYTVLY